MMSRQSTRWSMLAPLLLAMVAIASVHAQSPPSPPQQQQQQQQQPPSPLTLSELLSPQDKFPIPSQGKAFICENHGYLRQELPRSFVVDGVCDCCDGSDERVSPKGSNPFFPLSAKEMEEQKQKAAAGGGGAGGGWLSSLLGSADDEETDPSPCPNTCASVSRSFLLRFEERVAKYSRGVEAKSARLKTVPAINRKLTQDLARVEEQFKQAVEGYHRAKAFHEETQTQHSYDLLGRAQSEAGFLQYQVDNFKWLLSQPVPYPNNRQVQRPPATLGQGREWILFYDTCFDFAWPQRRFGAFGEMSDWYLIQVCPLSNTTQQAFVKPPIREGSNWRETEAEVSKRLAEEAEAEAMKQFMSPKELEKQLEKEEKDKKAAQAEPPRKYVLGYWQGDLMTESQRLERKKAREAAEEAKAGPAAGKKPQEPYKPLSNKASSAAATSFTTSGASAITEPVYFASLRNGDDCWQVGPRQVDLVLKCGDADAITRITENGKCKYEIELQTNVACEKDHLALLKKQLEEYKKFFQRAKPKAKPAKTLNEMLMHEDL